MAAEDLEEIAHAAAAAGHFPPAEKWVEGWSDAINARENAAAIAALI